MRETSAVARAFSSFLNSNAIDISIVGCYNWLNDNMRFSRAMALVADIIINYSKLIASMIV